QARSRVEPPPPGHAQGWPMTLADQLELVRQREQAQRLDQGEAEVLAKLATELPQPTELDQQTREDLQPFLAWTTQKSVRNAPPKPYVVAAFVKHELATGASTGIILRRVNAISVLHDRHMLADPVNTTVVRLALSDVITAVEPPRSWSKEQQAQFKTFPIQAQ